MNTILFAAARHDALRAARGSTPPRREYPFESGMDRRVFRRAISGEPLPDCERPIIFIQGPAASGKSTMVREIIATRFGDAHPWSASPKTEREFRNVIEQAILSGWPYVWFDNVTPPSIGLSFRSHSVAHYATVESAELRKFATQQVQRYTAIPQIIITGPIGPICSDVLRRTYLIRLDPAAAAQSAA